MVVAEVGLANPGSNNQGVVGCRLLAGVVWRVNNLSRYTRNGKWNIAELQMFVQLSNLFNLIKDPSERIARVRTIKLGATVAKFPGEKAKYTEALIAWATSLK